MNDNNFICILLEVVGIELRSLSLKLFAEPKSFKPRIYDIRANSLVGQ